MHAILIGLMVFLTLFLQGSVATFPLILVVLLLLYIYYRSMWIFFLAFIAGIFLDIFSVRPIGSTSIFLLTFLLSVFLYQRKFEIGSYYFIFFTLFLGGLIYSWTHGLPEGFFTALLLALFGISCFWCVEKTGRKKPILTAKHF